MESNPTPRLEGRAGSAVDVATRVRPDSARVATLPGVPSEEEFFRDRIESTVAAGYSPPLVFGLVVLALLIIFAPSIVAVRRLLGVDVRQMFISLGAVVVITPLTGFAVRYGPRSRAFRALDTIGMLAVGGGIMLLIHFSGTGVSFFWLFWFSWILANAATPIFIHKPLLALGPVALGLDFLFFKHDRGSAIAVGIAGACAYTAFAVLSSTSRALGRSEYERMLLERQLRTRAVEGERERIARDLHDGLGAELTALVWRARSLRATSEQGAADVEGLIDNVRRGLDELRNIIWVTRESHQDWATAVGLLRARCAQTCGDQVHWTVEDGGAPAATVLADDLALDLMRVAQEGVNNAVRHGKGSRVRVRLAIEGERLRLEVEDDGAGIDPKAVEKSKGGLRNIRNRVAARGGTFVVGPSQDGGTRLRIDLPRPNATSV